MHGGHGESFEEKHHTHSARKGEVSPVTEVGGIVTYASVGWRQRHQRHAHLLLWRVLSPAKQICDGERIRLTPHTPFTLNKREKAVHRERVCGHKSKLGCSRENELV